MKITPPNYTQTPNDLFDHWLPNLDEAELKLLLVIMRNTFGWHRTSAKLSLNEIHKLTGLKKDRIIKAAETLISKGLIFKNVIGKVGTQETHYELAIMEDSNISDQSPRGTPPSPPKGPPLVPQTDYPPLEKKASKERIKKDINNTSVETPSFSKNLIQRRQNIHTSEIDHEKLISKHGKEFLEQCYDELSEWKSNQTLKVQNACLDIGRIRKWVINNVTLQNQTKEKIKLNSLEIAQKQQRLEKFNQSINQINQNKQPQTPLNQSLIQELHKRKLQNAG